MTPQSSLTPPYRSEEEARREAIAKKLRTAAEMIACAYAGSARFRAGNNLVIEANDGLASMCLEATNEELRAEGID